MARPKADGLTQRELELMQVFWAGERCTAAQARDRLAQSGRELTYTTVANLCRILADKGYLAKTNDARPFEFEASKTFEDVSGDLVGELVDRVFRGSRERLLMHLFGKRRLTKKERAALQRLLEDDAS